MSTSTDRWNPLKLIETLAFFGEMPLIGNFRWLQQMLGAPLNPSAPLPQDLQPDSSVLLKAKDASAGESVQALLSERGISSQLSDAVFSASPSESVSNRMVNIHTVLWIGLTGDEADLGTYLEAIKNQPASEDQTLFDFRSVDKARFQDMWGAVDDVVMGGASTSGLSLLPSYARFSGTVSTANSGGFASVRTRNFEPPFDLTGWQGIRLVLRGDGQRYKVILRNSRNWDSAAYCASVDTEAERWIGVDIPFAALKATFRARIQPTAPPLDPSCVCAFQLMLSKFEYDGEKNPQFHPGAFSLDVQSVRSYRLVSPPLLVAIAASTTQATAYTNLLAQSNLAHQVIDSSNEQAFPDALVRAVATRRMV